MAKKSYVFKVECNNVHSKTDKNIFDTADFVVHIRKGVSGAEMSYALCTLLQVVLSHEIAAGNEMSIDGFTNLLNVMLKDMLIGIPEGEE